jgi:hypothetical protein
VGDVNTGATFADGAVATASSYNAKIHQEKPTSQTSFAAINGRLDDANFKAGEQVAFGEVRKGAFSEGKMVGNTLNIDIFKEMSISEGGLGRYLHNTRDTAADDDTTYVLSEVQAFLEDGGIPVIAIAWYNPYAVTQVRLGWTLAVSVSNAYFYAEDADDPTNGGGAGNGSGYILYHSDDGAFLTELEMNTGWINGFPPSGGYTNQLTGNDPDVDPKTVSSYLVGTKAALFINGTLQEETQCNFGDGENAYPDNGPLNSSGADKQSEYEFKAQRACKNPDMRFWSGALTIDSNIDSGALTKGWHSASIRLITDRRVVRVHCRHMLAHAIR